MALRGRAGTPNRWPHHKRHTKRVRGVRGRLRVHTPRAPTPRKPQPGGNAWKRGRKRRKKRCNVWGTRQVTETSPAPRLPANGSESNTLCKRGSLERAPPRGVHGRLSRVRLCAGRGGGGEAGRRRGVELYSRHVLGKTALKATQKNSSYVLKDPTEPLIKETK